MANHLLMADWAWHGTEPQPGLIDDGYPLGPHSLAATLADLLGTGLVEAFAGITLAIAALAAITALAALDRLPPLRRTLAGALAALPYLGAAYLAQGAFKEPIQALLLVAFVLLLVRARDRRIAIPLGVLLAGTIFNYSFPGLFWLAGAAAPIVFALVANAAHGVRPRYAVRRFRSRSRSPSQHCSRSPSGGASSPSPGSAPSTPRASRPGWAICARRCRRSRPWASGRAGSSGSRRPTRACLPPPSTSPACSGRSRSGSGPGWRSGAAARTPTASRSSRRSRPPR